MRVLSAFPLSVVVGAMALLPATLTIAPASRAPVPSRPCQSLLGVACPDSESPEAATAPSLPAGGAPAFLFALVQPIKAPEFWRTVYHEVERCAGMTGDYQQVRWSVMEAPLRGPKGLTYGFNIGHRIVLVRQDTTYLRHEMLHHILHVAGWKPRTLQPGERYSIADLHPLPLFQACAA